MENLQYLFAGFAVFWALILVYLLALQGRVRSLEREITRLEARLAENDGARAPGTDTPTSRSDARGPRRGAGAESSPTT